MNTVVHCKRESYDVYIGRKSLNVPDDNGGKWGNPFSHQISGRDVTYVASRDEAIAKYREWLWVQIQKDPMDRGWSLLDLAALDGKVLGCWCDPKPCHGHVLSAAAKWAVEYLASEGLTLGSEV